MRGRRCKPPGITSEAAGAGWWTSTWPSSSTESTTTCSWHEWQDESGTPGCSDSSAGSCSQSDARWSCAAKDTGHAARRAGVQFAVQGTGEPALEAAFRMAQQAHPGRVHVHIGYDEARAHRLVAGADAIAVPSRFEPYGLTQMYGADSVCAGRAACDCSQTRPCRVASDDGHGHGADLVVDRTGRPVPGSVPHTAVATRGSLARIPTNAVPWAQRYN